MGADMTIAICARHVDRDVAEARLRTLDNAVIGAAYNYGDKIDDDDITDYVSKAIGDLVWVYEYTRATTVFFIEGKEYVLSGGYSWGGYSWGDYPTDAYYPLNVISELGVTELDFEKGVPNELHRMGGNRSRERLVRCTPQRWGYVDSGC